MHPEFHIETTAARKFIWILVISVLLLDPIDVAECIEHKLIPCCRIHPAVVVGWCGLRRCESQGQVCIGRRFSPADQFFNLRAVHAAGCGLRSGPHLGHSVRCMEFPVAGKRAIDRLGQIVHCLHLDIPSTLRCALQIICFPAAGCYAYCGDGTWQVPRAPATATEDCIDLHCVHLDAIDVFARRICFSSGSC